MVNLEDLHSAITRDKSWAFEYDSEIKRQSLQWKSSHFPRPKKVKKSRSKVKVMLIGFFDSKSVVHLVSAAESNNQLARVQWNTAMFAPSSPNKWSGNVKNKSWIL